MSQFPEGAQITDLVVRPALKVYEIPQTYFNYACNLCRYAERYTSGPHLKECPKCKQIAFEKVKGIELREVAQTYGYISSGLFCRVCEQETKDSRLRPIGWEYICDGCKNYIKFVDVEQYVKRFSNGTRDQTTIDRHMTLNWHFKSRIRFQMKGDYGKLWSSDE